MKTWLLFPNRNNKFDSENYSSNVWHRAPPFLIAPTVYQIILILELSRVFAVVIDCAELIWNTAYVQVINPVMICTQAYKWKNDTKD